MTETERAELVSRAVAAWNADDLDGYLALLHPDLKMRLAGAFLGLDREYRGHEGFARFWEEFRSHWERIEVGVDQLEHHGEAMLAEFHFFGVGRDQLELEMIFYSCLEVGDRLLLRWSNFVEREPALEAVREAGQAGQRS